MSYSANIGQGITYPILKYGYLYNWYAVNTANFTPSGWHVATDSEWAALITYLGGNSVAGGKLKEAGFAHWLSPNTDADNSSGFTGLPSGHRSSTGTFYNLYGFGYYWTSTEFDVNGANFYYIYYNSASAPAVENALKKYGLAVRLVKDNSTNPGTLTDYDNNVYNCISINNVVWTQQNWKCTKLNNGTSLTNVTLDASWTALTTEGYCSYNNDDNNV